MGERGPWLLWNPKPFLQGLRSWGERKVLNTWIPSFPERAKSGKRNGFLHSFPWLLQARWRRVESSSCTSPWLRMFVQVSLGSFSGPFDK